MAIKIDRIWAMPNKWTFAVRGIKQLLSEEMNDGLWIDPFGGEYSPANIRNDIREEAVAESHTDGLEFLKTFNDQSVDGVLFDPPYTVWQAEHKYKNKLSTAARASYWAKCKDEIARILKPNGKSICFAWDSTGVGKKRGFVLTRVLVVCHGACHNDTIITTEYKDINANQTDSDERGSEPSRPEATQNPNRPARKEAI